LQDVQSPPPREIELQPAIPLRDIRWHLAWHWPEQLHKYLAAGEITVERRLELSACWRQTRLRQY
jgi:hypothetical protein